MLTAVFAQFLLLSCSVVAHYMPCDKTKSEILYIYEAEVNDCFAIRKTECEDREGLYNLAQCLATIRKETLHGVSAADTSVCAGGHPTVNRTDGTFDCDSNDLQYRRCPEGAVCKGLICCDASTESTLLTEKYTTSCAPGVKASRENGQILYSKNCSINFCPQGVDCVMGKHYAFCCPPF